MWLEEEILSYQCRQKGYRVLYHPSIRVLHQEEVSTKSSSDSALKKYEFFSVQLRHSAKVMLRVMGEKGRANGGAAP